jgi:hypothetical protein
MIINTASGAAAAGNVGAVEDVFARVGLEARIVRVRGPEVLGAAERAAAAGHALIAAGGDGTVSTVASVAVRTGAIFGIVPLGTLNHFARDAGIPLNLEKGADLFLSGHLHLSHVSHSAERYRIAGHSALIVQAGTVSMRGRGEEPSFNILRLEPGSLALGRFIWDPAATVFTEAAAGLYRRADDGWRVVRETS